MNTKNIFLISLLLLGEALIIISFLYFGKLFSTEVLTLNIVVSSVIYSLFFVDILFPMVDFGDRTQKSIGSLGIRWFISILYIIFAIVVMVMFIILEPEDTNIQILVQAILFFMLLFGMYSALASSEKVKETYTKEKEILNRLEEIRLAMNEVMIKLDQVKEIPDGISSGLASLQDDLRFISPCNNHSAHELEVKLLLGIKTLKERLYEIPLHNEEVVELTNNCRRICKARKQIFSN